MNPQAPRGAARGHGLPDGAVRRRRRRRRPTPGAHRMLDALGETEHDAGRGVLRRPRPRGRAVAGRARPGSAPPRTSRTSRDTWEGWEDSAVARRPARRLPARPARALRGVRLRHDTGPACTATSARAACTPASRSTSTRPRASATYRRFLERAADLVVVLRRLAVRRARRRPDPRRAAAADVRRRRWSPCSSSVKAIFDPDDRMNPGKVVAPRRRSTTTCASAVTGRRDEPRHLYFAYPDDGHSFRQAANRCVGVGKCRQHEHDGGAVMCPSYQVTARGGALHPGPGPAAVRDARRPRRRPITDGWRSTEVRDALDLCLACKGCKTDCPRRRRHGHLQGRVPRPPLPAGCARAPTTPWLAAGRAAGARATGCAPALVNALTRDAAAGAARPPGRRAGGPRRSRSSPPQTLQQWWARRRPAPDAAAASAARCCSGRTPSPTTSTPQIGRAAVEVLEDAGWEVTIPAEPLCCGLTWISTGQLDVAKRVLRRTVDCSRRTCARAGWSSVSSPAAPRCSVPTPPSCSPTTSTSRGCATTPSRSPSCSTSTPPGWEPPDAATAVEALAQVHCHQHAS